MQKTQCATTDRRDQAPDSSRHLGRGAGIALGLVGLGLAGGLLSSATAASAGTPAFPSGTQRVAASVAYPRGHVQDGYLRSEPTTQSTALARLVDQDVEIVCWTQGENAQGTAKWFRAQYYSTTGYLNANIVTNQPGVGAC